MGYAILDQRGGDSLTATTLDGYSLLADTTVSSATTTVNFTGLNIGWGDELLLVSTVIGTNSVCGLFVNGNTNNLNYYEQQYQVNGSALEFVTRNNQSYIFYTDSSTTSQSFSKIKLTNNGYFVYQSQNVYGTNSNIKIQNLYNTSTFTTSSITSLTINAQNANAIGVGSRFQLYKSGGGASRTWAIT